MDTFGLIDLTIAPFDTISDFPARLGLKAQQMAWLLMAQAQKGTRLRCAGFKERPWSRRPLRSVRSRICVRGDRRHVGVKGIKPHASATRSGEGVVGYIEPHWVGWSQVIGNSRACFCTMRNFAQMAAFVGKVAKEIGWVGEQCACRARESGEARGKAMLEESTQSAGECREVWVRTARKSGRVQSYGKVDSVTCDTAHQIQSRGHRPWEWLTKSKAEATSHSGPLRGSGLAWPLMCGLGWLLA
ncbi:hypothetical protein EDB83DRAFT_2604369 [Lactarius deliciosus]|nr:hypothetical protein EDB83DRAFT_2604369 [Lactarius deliciosus]